MLSISHGNFKPRKVPSLNPFSSNRLHRSRYLGRTLRLDSSVSLSIYSLVVTIPLALGIVTAPAASADTNCNGASGHCYAIATIGGQGNPIWMNGLSSDLEVDCLAVQDPNTDFVDYEMWMNTNDNISGSNTWIEEGMTAGTLTSAPGQPVGFQWYWADQRALPGQGFDYWEHYIGAANTNQYVDAGFIWRPNTGDWDVWHDHQLIGGSIGVGAYAGGGQNGIEETTLASAIVGNTGSWRYADTNNNYVWAPNQGVYNSRPSDLSVTTNGPTVAARTTSDCWPGTTSAQQAPAAPATDQTIRSAVSNTAKNLGELAPTKISQVKSTRASANKAANNEMGGNEPIIEVQAHGHFTIPGKPNAKGHTAPQSGDTMTLIIDAASGAVTDWSVSTKPPRLETLGTPTPL